MTTYSFPAASFAVEGSPEAVRETGHADLLTAEGKHVQVLPEDHTVQRRKSVDFLVRERPDDPGVISELKTLRSPSSSAVQRNILEAGGQLDQYKDRYGPGRAVVDGRGVG